MTGEEFKRIAKGLKSAYASQSFLPDEDSARMWYRMLRDLDFALVAAAAQRHICQSRFPPTIAELREQCAQLSAPPRRDWAEGWGEVQRAIGRYGAAQPERALAALGEYDRVTGEVVGRLGWTALCMSENPMADRANFRQCYEAMVKFSIAEQGLPAELRRGMPGAESRKIADGKDEDLCQAEAGYRLM